MFCHVSTHEFFEKGRLGENRFWQIFLLREWLEAAEKSRVRGVSSLPF
jgi:hypothetical protein